MQKFLSNIGTHIFLCKNGTGITNEHELKFATSLSGGDISVSVQKFNILADEWEHQAQTTKSIADLSVELLRPAAGKYTGSIITGDTYSFLKHMVLVGDTTIAGEDRTIVIVRPRLNAETGAKEYEGIMYDCCLTGVQDGDTQPDGIQQYTATFSLAEQPKPVTVTEQGGTFTFALQST